MPRQARKGMVMEYDRAYPTMETIQKRHRHPRNCQRGRSRAHQLNRRGGRPHGRRIYTMACAPQRQTLRTARRLHRARFPVVRPSPQSGGHWASASRGLSGIGLRPVLYPRHVSIDPRPFLRPAIQLTASHHPFYRNGLKFFTPDGGLDAADIETILMAAQDDLHPDAMPGGTIQTVEFMRQYAAGLRQMICDGVGGDRPLEGFHIVVTRATAQAASMPARCSLPWGPTSAAAGIWNPTACFPTIFPIPRTKRRWPPFAKRC